MDLEGIINFGMLAVAFFLSVCFTLMNIRKTGKRSTFIWKSLGVGFGLFALAAVISFFVYTDALNLLAIWVLYALAYIISSLINLGVIIVRTR
ncbi:hypothetical protein SAMN02799630_05411 [Paenibacillus sp. UNCCL117]|uniref:hypothetical protein n=1 Tax=unclassified Paenibacillus TaxID=185978 RepID=UPI00088FADAC|nr:MULTISPECIES: hypothetical protein [unclassified Paenibacillus]SDE47374.1 hypothetical protein SAMN04488602_12955 [Paenibacillus sp. cl123]SFW65711.1 hypothetical protein SAMN02799630_05411 [Paenibacillus sp. UNCCL117]